MPALLSTRYFTQAPGVGVPPEVCVQQLCLPLRVCVQVLSGLLLQLDVMAVCCFHQVAQYRDSQSVFVHDPGGDHLSLVSDKPGGGEPDGGGHPAGRVFDDHELGFGWM